MKLPCEVVQDLIPLCKDGVASKESCQLVEEHMTDCTLCKSDYEIIHEIPAIPASLDEKKFLQNLRYSSLKFQGLLILSGAVLGVSLTFSMNIFYNVLLMPLVGIVAYFAFRQKVYIAPALVFVLSILSNAIYGVLGERLGISALGNILTSWIMFSTIYAGLTLVGWSIGWLLHYAFGKEETMKN